MCDMGYLTKKFPQKLAKLVKATPKKKHIYPKNSQFLCKKWKKYLKNRSLVGIELKIDGGLYRRE
jgi:hypothetical protein